MGERGFAPVLGILAMLAVIGGLGAGIYLSQHKTNATPQAQTLPAPDQAPTAVNNQPPAMPVGIIPPELQAIIQNLTNNLTPTPNKAAPTPTTPAGSTTRADVTQPTATPQSTPTPVPTSHPTQTPTPTPTPTTVPTGAPTATPSPTTGISSTPTPTGSASPTVTNVPSPTTAQRDYKVSFNASFTNLVDTGDNGIFGSGNEKTISLILPGGPGTKPVYVQFLENGQWVPATPVVTTIDFVSSTPTATPFPTLTPTRSPTPTPTPTTAPVATSTPVPTVPAATSTPVPTSAPAAPATPGPGCAHISYAAPQYGCPNGGGTICLRNGVITCTPD